MLGDHNLQTPPLILDTSTISQIFSAFSHQHFPTFWARFDQLVLDGCAESIRAVRDELTVLAKVSGAVTYLENLNTQFFAAPTPQEQALAQAMFNDPRLATAANRWRTKTAKGTVDADPYLIAKGLASPIATIVVTEETQDMTRTASIFYVCHYYGVDCLNHRQMMSRLGWVF